jgi:uncharacterized protein
LGSVHLVGLISDTHGLIRPEALALLRKAELIVHCGDIGDAAVLEALEIIAPVRAIRGNNDRGAWAARLPTHDIVQIAGQKIYVLHNLSELDFDPAVAGFTAVVAGHSHKAGIRKCGKVLFINPGSAGPRRFHLSVTLAMLVVRNGRVEASIINLA